MHFAETDTRMALLGVFKIIVVIGHMETPGILHRIAVDMADQGSLVIVIKMVPGNSDVIRAALYVRAPSVLPWSALLA